MYFNLNFSSDHLQPATVNDQIFPQLANGFMDTNATIREHTVKVQTLNLFLDSLLNFLF